MSRSSKKVKRTKTMHKNTLSPELISRLYELAEKGHKLTHNGQYMDAIYVWNEAIELIPEPKQNHLETANFIEAIAYNYQMLNLFPQALVFMKKLLRYWGEDVNKNPFILRSLGEIYYELGEMECAADYLRRAFILEGDEIFDADCYGKIEHNKYFEFLKNESDFE